MVSDRQRTASMRRLAVRALDAFPLADRELRLVADEENTTFRVDATAPDGRDRFLLRVHRPARHGRNVDSAAAIGSELGWLTASVLGAALDGRPSPHPRPVHLRRLGSVMARLHNHAGQWRVPPGFVRIRWNWETFFGDTMVYGGISAAEVWDLLPDNLRRRFAQVASGMRSVMTHLGEGADTFGLIHADLHLGNALFWRDEVKVIDFDDCGFGYWLYDIAVALWELRHRHDYQDFRSALIDGYTRHRPLPAGVVRADQIRGDESNLMTKRHKASNYGPAS